MSDFDEKLNALLSDPDRMAQIIQMAQSLSGTASPPPASNESFHPHESVQQQPASPPPHTSPAGDILSSLTGGLDPKLLMKLLPLIQDLGAENNSDARALLYALRPYLKQERQSRIECALQLAKLLHIGKKALKSWEG